jgi:uncharacterized protein (DUF433 family)
MQWSLGNPYALGSGREETFEATRPSGVASGFSRQARCVRRSMIPELIELITCDPGILEGIPVISGTLVPVRMLLEYRRAGQPLYEFLFDFPTVSRKQAKKLWAWISRDGEAAVHATLQRLAHGAHKKPRH